MAENKFVAKIFYNDDEDGKVFINEEYFATKKEAESFKSLADYAYGLQFGENQTKVTTEIFNL